MPTQRSIRSLRKPVLPRFAILVTLLLRNFAKKNDTFFASIELIVVKYVDKSNQPHAVSRTQQVRQRESSVKTLLSPLSAEFWGHCVHL